MVKVPEKPENYVEMTPKRELIEAAIRDKLAELSKKRQTVMVNKS